MKSTDQLFDRAPPAAPDSERYVIGNALVNPRTLDSASADVEPEHFADGDLGSLYGALRELHRSGVAIDDPAGLIPRLAKLKLPGDVGSIATLNRLIAAAGLGKDVAYHAAQIRNAAKLRRLFALATNAAQAIHEPGAVADDVLATMQGRLAAEAANAGDAESRTLAEIAAAEVLAIADAHDIGAEPSLLTGLPSFDQTAGGFQAGELVILAARPGCGKTTLGMQIARHVAERGRSALFVSLEMRDAELVRRILAGDAGVNSRAMRTGRLSRPDVSAIIAASENYRELPLRIWSPASATLERIAGVARLNKATSGLALLVVDYLSLVRPADPRIPRHEQVAAVSRGLKALAKELELPVLALCQLNREADGEEPRLSQLRESGSIEQDADIVLLLHPSTDKRSCNLIVAKHRHGETGTLTLGWDRAGTRFDDQQFASSTAPGRNHDLDAWNTAPGP